VLINPGNRRHRRALPRTAKGQRRITLTPAKLVQERHASDLEWTGVRQTRKDIHLGASQSHPTTRRTVSSPALAKYFCDVNPDARSVAVAKLILELSSAKHAAQNHQHNILPPA